ncbi:MAG: hypothetical protein ABS939_00360 [Psychrobacillus sp.]
MNIREKIDSKWNEITAIKDEKLVLFSDFENNKERFIEIHYEGKIKQLQYLFLMRQRFEQLKKTTFVPENDEKINEERIKELQEVLIKQGFEQQLKVEKLI